MSRASASARLRRKLARLAAGGWRLAAGCWHYVGFKRLAEEVPGWRLDQACSNYDGGRFAWELRTIEVDHQVGGVTNIAL